MSDSGLQVFRAEGLLKAFGDRTVVQDVSVQVEQGTVVGLLGPNGAGKTTCFYMMVGLVNADSGNIFIDQLDIAHMPMYHRARLGLGYLPQEASIFRDMTVEDNIYSILEITETNEIKRKEKLEELLIEFSIEV